MEFEWDQEKDESNIKKHDVSFREATTVFADRLAFTFDDPDHSVAEQRSLTFGMSKTEKLLIVSHTERQGAVRIISARLMTKQERLIYEEE